MLGSINKYDEQVAKYLEICKHANVTVHVRGKDEKPVLEFLDKDTRRVVGGIEMKRRLGK
jgi:hypothetical protein